MKGWMTSVEFAEEFFTRCLEKEAVTLPEREKIMEDLVKELKAIRMNEKDLKNVIRNKNVAVVRKSSDIKK